MTDFGDDAELAGQYIAWTKNALVEMRDINEMLTATEPPDDLPADMIDSLYGLSHNIKGMGSSFDYGLMTEIGASLCLYLKKRPDGTPYDGGLVTSHLKAFDVVIENDIRGLGGEKGQAVIARLKQLVSDAIQA